MRTQRVRHDWATSLSFSFFKILTHIGLYVVLSGGPVLSGMFLLPAKSLQSYLTLCDPVACSPPGSSVRGALQAGYWSGLLCPSPGGLPDPGIEPALFMTNLCWQVGSLPLALPWKPMFLFVTYFFFFLFLAVPRGKWVLISLIRDGTHAPCSGSSES